MLCIESLSCRSTFTEGYISPWVPRTHHSKKIENAAAKHMKKSKTFVSKWMKRYSNVKNDDLLDCDSVQNKTKKEDKMILQEFKENPRLSLRTSGFA